MVNLSDPNIQDLIRQLPLEKVMAVSSFIKRLTKLRKTNGDELEPEKFREVIGSCFGKKYQDVDITDPESLTEAFLDFLEVPEDKKMLVSNVITNFLGE